MIEKKMLQSNRSTFNREYDVGMNLSVGILPADVCGWSI